MANKATAEKVAADMRPPDYRYAVQTIRGGVNQKKAKVSSLNGELSDLYAKIESKGVHPKAAKFWAGVDKLEPVERMQIMRSFNGMCDASGWPETDGDMVDAAEGKVVQMRMGKGESDADTNVDEGEDADTDSNGDEDEDDEGDDEPEPAPSGRKRSGLEVLRETKAKMAADDVTHEPVALDAEQRRAQKVQDLRALANPDPDFA